MKTITKQLLSLTSKYKENRVKTTRPNSKTYIISVNFSKKKNTLFESNHPWAYQLAPLVTTHTIKTLQILTKPYTIICSQFKTVYIPTQKNYFTLLRQYQPKGCGFFRSMIFKFNASYLLFANALSTTKGELSLYEFRNEIHQNKEKNQVLGSF